ncbi:hypothetical protein IRJ41_006209 [Triplophysa rosa]|uniref:3',5'-cyclic-GMP phosphodiesterase n=1 Tax=Triplophysa rosa TaxID=992332 RepID=A0A9W7WLA5_TRIRA|nr:hypothetical protein IRJ41_006209 [Triplophysa rosa]
MSSGNSTDSFSDSPITPTRVGGPTTPRRMTRQFKSKPPKKGVKAHHRGVSLHGKPSAIWSCTSLPSMVLPEEEAKFLGEDVSLAVKWIRLCLWIPPEGCCISGHVHCLVLYCKL